MIIKPINQPGWRQWLVYTIVKEYNLNTPLVLRIIVSSYSYFSPPPQSIFFKHFRRMNSPKGGHLSPYFDRCMRTIYGGQNLVCFLVWELWLSRCTIKIFKGGGGGKGGARSGGVTVKDVRSGVGAG